MKYQFEHEGFNVCGDCPCWCPHIIEQTWASNDGICFLDFEHRNRFDDKPLECTLEEIKEVEE